MREFKYRAWDGSKMVIFVLCDLYWRGETTGEYDFPLGLPVMQYTGLRDKNGVEIHEGDIIKTIIHMIDRPITGSVVYEDKYAHFSVLTPTVPSEPIPLYGLRNIEVIGNIHENPELLEAKS